MARCCLLLLCGLLSACGYRDLDREWVSRALRAHGVLGGALEVRPQGARGSRTVSEDDAVVLALAHSPSYRADLARLDAARADLREARRPSNPQLTLLGAAGPVSAMATLLAPLESLWQVPLRSELAARTLEGVAHALVQSGLDLARDVRVAHIARGLAEERVRARAEIAQLAASLSTLASERVRLGEAAAVEGAALRAEAALASDVRALSEGERSIARARLRTLLGMPADAPGFDVIFTRALAEPPSLPVLAKLAHRARPDVRAAELALLAAGARLGWERSRVIVLAGQLEGHWTRPDTLASRFGARLELPLFGLNPGGIGRAQAEIARATAAFSALHQRVGFEILQAHTRSRQAQASLARYRDEVLPALEQARASAVQSYRLGEDTYVVVVDVLRRLAEARLREVELVAEARSALAELERAVGARVGADT